MPEDYFLEMEYEDKNGSAFYPEDDERDYEEEAYWRDFVDE